jgi:hypothetical protein
MGEGLAQEAGVASIASMSYDELRTIYMMRAIRSTVPYVFGRKDVQKFSHGYP